MRTVKCLSQFAINDIIYSENTGDTLQTTNMPRAISVFRDRISTSQEERGMRNSSLDFIFHLFLAGLENKSSDVTSYPFPLLWPSQELSTSLILEKKKKQINK